MTPRTPSTEAGREFSLCDHPTSARVRDSGGWSCSRCEAFIDADDSGNPPDESAVKTTHSDGAITRLRRALADLVYEAGSDYEPDEVPLGSPLARALHALADEPDCSRCRAALEEPTP
jgi:hypothetical protein